jgi:hypothetical protein
MGCWLGCGNCGNIGDACGGTLKCGEECPPGWICEDGICRSSAAMCMPVQCGSHRQALGLKRRRPSQHRDHHRHGCPGTRHRADSRMRWNGCPEGSAPHSVAVVPPDRSDLGQQGGPVKCPARNGADRQRMMRSPVDNALSSLLAEGLRREASPQVSNSVPKQLPLRTMSSEYHCGLQGDS